MSLSLVFGDGYNDYHDDDNNDDDEEEILRAVNFHIRFLLIYNTKV